ncbi:MAG TPA: hypothetical protein VI072_25845 [Polyangiaceae bacterium]
MRANNAIIADGMLNQSIGSGQLNGFSFANTNTCPGTTTSNAKIIIHYPTHAKQINGIGATLGSAHACIEGDHPYP